MCGAEDCPECKPYNFIDGVYVDPEEEDLGSPLYRQSYTGPEWGDDDFDWD